jgi:hypothetical protein
MDAMFAIFFVILMIVSSLANKLKEKKELERRNKSRRGREDSTGGTQAKTRRVVHGNRPASTGDEQVRTARPKEARPATRTQETVAPGKQLLETLLGEINQDADDWVPVEPKARRELPVPPMQRSHEQHSHEDVRQQAQAAREQHEAKRIRRQSSQQRPPVQAQRSTPSALDAGREQRRQEILEERERRKQARQDQQQKSKRAARQQQASRKGKTKRTSARPAATRYAHWLHSKDTVRNAIVLSEILGPPKSFREDDQRII